MLMYFNRSWWWYVGLFTIVELVQWTIMVLHERDRHSFIFRMLCKWLKKQNVAINDHYFHAVWILFVLIYRLLIQLMPRTINVRLRFQLLTQWIKNGHHTSDTIFIQFYINIKKKKKLKTCIAFMDKINFDKKFFSSMNKERSI